MNPKITFGKLLEKTGESESNIIRVLSTHSSTISCKPFERLHESWYKEHTDLLVHNIVTTTQNNDGKLTYDLSLFGIMLCLVLVRYNDMDRLKGGLYFKDFSLEQYYDKIASNYKEKLPLIFAKWNHLKRNLKLFTAYNLDIVIDKEPHYNNAGSVSVIMGGNQELIEGIRAIKLYNSKLMRDFADAGSEVLKNYIQQMFINLDVWNRPEFQKIYPLCAKFEEVMMLLHPTSFAYPTISMFNFRTRPISSILLKMEKAFADEITAFYYINLHNDYNMQIDSICKYYHFSETDKSKLPDCTPKQCLSSILQEDPQIKEWFSKWMQDLVSYQEEVLQNIKALSDSFHQNARRETMPQ